MGRLSVDGVMGKQLSLRTFEVWYPALKQAVEQLYAWKERQRLEPYASLIISGPPDTGKTHLAGIVYWSVTQWVEERQVKEPTGRLFNAEGVLSQLNTARTEEVIGGSWPVILDEVGDEEAECDKWGERARRGRYRRLMQHCFIYQLPVVVVTRLPILDRDEDLVDWIGDEAWEILYRMASPKGVIDLAGMPAYSRIVRYVGERVGEVVDR